MSNSFQATGCVLSAMPIGENDKRIVLLTRELGRISAFARGARRPGSPLMAACNPFVFGTFTLIQGRNSWTVRQVEVMQYFTELAGLQPEIYYGFYFLDFAGYYSREGIDETASLNLLYLSVKALMNPKLDNRLVRRMFEIRLMTINGEFSPEQVTEKNKTDDNTAGTAAAVMRYAAAAPLNRMYTVAVSEEVLKELEIMTDRLLRRTMDRSLKSLAVLESFL